MEISGDYLIAAELTGFFHETKVAVLAQISLCESVWNSAYTGEKGMDILDSFPVERQGRRWLLTLWSGDDGEIYIPNGRF